jgi:hypothetical protein
LRADPRFAEPSLAHVGGILEDAPHRRTVPVRLTPWARDLALLELTTDLADRATIQRDPRENLADDFRLCLDDLVSRLPAPFVLSEHSGTHTARHRGH